jgi:DNA-binding NtrC family response regulator
MSENQSRPLPLREYLAIVRQAYIMKALEENGWHRIRTAKALGISAHQMFDYIKKYGVTKRFRERKSNG